VLDVSVSSAGDRPNATLLVTQERHALHVVPTRLCSGVDDPPTTTPDRKQHVSRPPTSERTQGRQEPGRNLP
jgi:hypothetical protein